MSPLHVSLHESADSISRLMRLTSSGITAHRCPVAGGGGVVGQNDFGVSPLTDETDAKVDDTSRQLKVGHRHHGV